MQISYSSVLCLKRSLSFAPLIALVCVIALSSTTGVGIGASWFDEQRILCSIALIVASITVLARNVTSYPGRPGWALVIVLTLGAMSSIVAIRPYVASLDWAVYCLMGIVVVYASLERRYIQAFNCLHRHHDLNVVCRGVCRQLCLVCPSWYSRWKRYVFGWFQ